MLQKFDTIKIKIEDETHAGSSYNVRQGSTLSVVVIGKKIFIFNLYKLKCFLIKFDILGKST